jgi:hypothetical protein
MHSRIAPSGEQHGTSPDNLVLLKSQYPRPEQNATHCGWITLSPGSGGGDATWFVVIGDEFDLEAQPRPYRAGALQRMDDALTLKSVLRGVGAMTDRDANARENSAIWAQSRD